MKGILRNGRLFLVLGAILAFGAVAFAASSNVNFEAEAGTRAGSVGVVSDASASGGSAVGFTAASTGSCPTGQVGTPPNCISASSALGVDARTVVNKFDPRMKGLGFGNWTFSFGDPYINEVQGLSQAVSAISPGILRYAGGTKGNYYGFNRNFTDNAFDVEWTQNGKTYAERYGTRELASLDAFAKSVGAQVMIQVNVSTHDPAMWADLVRYVKEQNLSSIRYYEFSNELDLETFSGNSDAIDPVTYGNRVKEDQQAMLAVDPTIKLVGGVPASTSDIMRAGYSCCGSDVSQYITQGVAGAKAAGRDLSSVSIHWYENRGNNPSDVFSYSTGNPTVNSAEWWREAYSYGWGDKVGPWVRSAALANSPNTELGISELNVDSGFNPVPAVNGNHIGALWFSDELGRLAYNDIDWATEWDGYGKGADDNFSLLYGNSGAINVRPTYAAYLMYNKYFGDQMVKSSTTDTSKLSIWASKDTKDPTKLKLRITNFTANAITTPVAMNGFTATSGQAYTLSSTNPTDASANSTTSSAPTTINGVKINGMNVAGSLTQIQPTNVTASGTSFNYTIPAYSSAAIILNGSF